MVKRVGGYVAVLALVLATMTAVSAAAGAGAVTYKVVASTPVPFGGAPVAVNSKTGRAYEATNSSSSEFAIIDTASNALIGYTPYANDGSPFGVAVNETTNQVLISAVAGLAIVDGNSNTLVANVALPDWGTAVTVNPATNTIYVGLRNGTVDVVNGQTHAVTATIQLSSPPADMAADPASNTVFVSELSGSVEVIDGRFNRVVRTITGSGSQGIAVDQSAGLVYAAAPFDHTLVVIDAQSGGITASIPLGTSPSDVALDPKTRTVWVSDRTEGNVTVVDGATNTVTAVVPTGQYTQGMAVDSATGTGYVAVGHDFTAIAPQRVDSPDTVTYLQATPGEATVTLPVTLTATVVNADGGGAVTFGTGMGASFTAIPGCTGIPVQRVGGESGASCTTTSLGVGPHLITAEYGGDSASHPSSGSSYVNVSLIKTTLVADPVLLRLQPLAAPLFTLRIHLSALGSGLANAPVTLYLNRWDLPPSAFPLCQLTTTADGSASCTVADPATQLDLIVGGGYGAVYDGDALHARSEATGAVVSVH